MATSKWQKDTESPLYTFESKDWRYRGCCTCSRLRQAWCRLWSSLTWGTSSASRRVMMNSAWLIYMGKHELYNCAISICPLKTFKGYWKKQGLWNWRFLLYMFLHVLRELFIFVLQRFPHVFIHPCPPWLSALVSLLPGPHMILMPFCACLFSILHICSCSLHIFSAIQMSTIAHIHAASFCSLDFLKACALPDCVWLLMILRIWSLYFHSAALVAPSGSFA